MRNSQIDEKFLRSQKVVQEFKRSQDHKFMLVQEERKLNEQAMDVLKIRMKRMDSNKKQEIMDRDRKV